MGKPPGCRWEVAWSFDWAVCRREVLVSRLAKVACQVYHKWRGFVGARRRLAPTPGAASPKGRDAAPLRGNGVVS